MSPTLSRSRPRLRFPQPAFHYGRKCLGGIFGANGVRDQWPTCAEPRPGDVARSRHCFNASDSALVGAVTVAPILAGGRASRARPFWAKGVTRSWRAQLALARGGHRTPDSRHERTNPVLVEVRVTGDVGHLPPASILGRQTRALLGVRTAVATPVRYRGAPAAARVVWQESVGHLSEPVRTCRRRLNQPDEVASAGGTPRQVMDVPVRDGSTWAKGGFQRNTGFESRTSSVTRLAHQGVGKSPISP